MTTKDVTLLMVDAGENVPQSAKTINHCAGLLNWGAVRLFCYKKPPVPINGETFIISRCKDLGERSNFMGQLGPCFFETEFMLYIHNDGYPINPHLWQDSWLEWDYVAPPWSIGFMKHVAGAWPELHRTIVGSGACVLRSKKMAKATAKLAVERGGIHAGLDFFECILKRAELERMGVRFAPPDVGLKFCYQLPLEEYPGWTDDKSFSFHCMSRELGAPQGRKML